MLQSLRGLKLPRRLLTALYRRIIALLLHCVKHPIKTVFFIIKAYLLLMLFAFFLAFSVGSFAQETPPVQCATGETYLPGLGCGIVAPEVSCQITRINGRSHQGSVIYTGAKVSEYTTALSNYNKVTTGGNGTNCPWSYSDTYTHSFDYSCSSAPNQATSVNVPYTITFVREGSTRNWYGGACEEHSANQTDVNDEIMAVQIEWSDEVQCPESYPVGPVTGPAPHELNQWCYRIPVPDPCDCSELNGEGPNTSQSFLANSDAYSQENPPACLNIRDSFDATVPECKCQIVATKWFSQIAVVNGVEMTRWQPLPTPAQNGQSGIFTGKACGDDETTTPPAEKENCITMKNGEKLCIAEKAKKCIMLDGVEQCESGCGTLNGEFVCTEKEDPNNQDPDDPDIEPDDDIDDPDKTTEQMTKRDYKEVNKGIETRLDLLAQLVERQNNKATAGGAANGAKIDSTNRLLGSIDGKLDELIAQGEGGECEGDDCGGGEDGNPQPEYSTEALQEFVNPNDWEQRNFGTVLQAAVERMQQAPVFTAVESFFQVSISGTCPTWQATVPMLNGSFDINIDQLCSPTMEQIWPMIKAIILLGFSILAFRAAIL